MSSGLIPSRADRVLRILSLIALIQALACGSVRAGGGAASRTEWTPDVEEPWEPELTTARHFPQDERPAPEYRPIGDVFSWLVDYYRAEIGPDSIRRCPFHETCSAFAQRTLREHGALGILWIMDRYFYREHAAAGRYYERVSERSRILKLDDGLHSGSD